MRTAFLVLLSANLLFLAWAQWIDGPRDEAAQDSLAKLPRLQLVEEAPPALKPTSELAQKMSYHPFSNPDAVCTSIGPFNEIKSAARAAGRLRELGYRPQQRAEPGETLQGFWVFIAGLRSDDDMARIMDKLEKNGFTDAHVMKPSADGRRVSVGLFSARERAERRAKAMALMGLDPQISERDFPGTLYWVDVSAQPDAPHFNAPGLLAQIGYQNARIRSCPANVEPAPNEYLSPEDEDGIIVRSLPRTTVAAAPTRK